MIVAVTSSITALPSVLLAGLLMIVVGVTKKRLRWRTAECPVCHHPRTACTCRWL
jgi:hypothetical protein